MRTIFTTLLLVWLIARQTAIAQTTPFSASWSFEGSLNGSSSTPLVTANTATLSNILVPSVGGYPSGQVGKTLNLQNWTDPACPGTEYIEIKVSPANSVTMVLTTLSFYYSKSFTGPKSIKVKSSLDGYTTPIYSSPISATAVPYQLASVNLASLNSAFAAQTQPVSFRIYGCDRDAINGSMRLDEITINATALPITLLSFTVKSDGDRVQLAWATTMERQADRFVVERSRDLGEFVVVGELAATGTTDVRQYYELTDLNPLPGVNYYRLKQVDQEGAAHYFKPVSVVIDTDEPVISVYPNPTEPDHIHLRLWNTEQAAVRLVTSMGQSVEARLERQSGEADLFFDHPLSPGLYWLEIQMGDLKRTLKLVVR